MPELTTAPEPIAEHRNGSGQEHQHGNGRLQPWTKAGSLGSIVAGSALAIYGASRKSARGTALAAAGSLLALRGIRRATRPQPVHIERSFTINRPVEEVYSFFRDFENLPKFMHHLKRVEHLGERRSHWVAHAPLGLELEWDADIIEEAANSYIIWQSLPGALIPNRGAVEFQPASQYHGGTEISVTMNYAPPGGRGGALFARVFGREPEIQVREDLRRFKQLMEAGEIPTTEGQSHGRRGAFVRMMEAVQQPSSKHKVEQSEQQPWAMSS